MDAQPLFIQGVNTPMLLCAATIAGQKRLTDHSRFSAYERLVEYA